MTYRLARITGILAIGLILYLPLEPAILTALPSGLYWFLRLAPDALIAIVAAALVLAELRSPSFQTRLLLLLGAIAVAVIVLDWARGFAVVDTVNALRVVVRYPILGIVLWRAAPFLPRFPERLLPAVMVAGLVQLAAGIAEVVSRLATPQPLGLGSLWFIQGTTGRYDQFGFSMATLGIVVLVLVGKRLDRRLLLALLLACVVGAALLALTTSRQAILGLVVAVAALATGRLLWRHRVALVALSAALALMIPLVPSTIPVSAGTQGQNPTSPGSGSTQNPDGADSGSVTIIQQKGATSLTIDPNGNFRAYLNVVLMPWAAVQEPLLGFGPRQQLAVDANPRLRAFVASSGMDWAYATLFTGDSNYASLVIQFGLILPLLLFLVIAFLTFSAFRASRRERPPGLQLFAFAVGAAFIVAAAFGPAFEARIASSVLWISLFTAYAYRADMA